MAIQPCGRRRRFCDGRRGIIPPELNSAMGIMEPSVVERRSRRGSVDDKAVDIVMNGAAL